MVTRRTEQQATESEVMYGTRIAWRNEGETKSDDQRCDSGLGPQECCDDGV